MCSSTVNVGNCCLIETNALRVARWQHFCITSPARARKETYSRLSFFCAPRGRKSADARSEAAASGNLRARDQKVFRQNERVASAGAAKREPLKLDKGTVTPGEIGMRLSLPFARAGGNVMDSHYGCVLGHIMNNSYRLGSDVPFAETATDFGGNQDAAEQSWPGQFLQ